MTEPSGTFENRSPQALAALRGRHASRMDVIVGPDGLVYLAMTDPGQIVRLVAAEP